MKVNVRGYFFIILILVVGIFLRFYKIDENIVFHSELGNNYLDIKNFLLAGKIPLIGPTTSHPWLSFGPLFYWIMSPLFAIFDFNPKIGSYFFAFEGCLLILVNYLFIRSIFNEKISLISSFIISISPVFISYARDSRFFSLVLLIFYPFLYFFLKAIQKHTNPFWFGFFYGLFFSFHFSPLIFLPVILYLLVKSKVTISQLIKAFVGFLLPNLTLIINDLLNRGQMLKNLFLWIPYRILGFLNVIPQNNFDKDLLLKNFSAILNFFNSIFVPPIGYLNFLGLFIVGLLLFFIFSTSFKKETNVLLLIAVFGLLALFIHGDPPYHYFLPILPALVILVSLSISVLYQKYKLITIFASFIFILINFNYYFSNNWFFQYKKVSNKLVPYEIQYKISKAIVDDASGKPFVLKRVGYFDNFENNYSDNYIYLMWYLGNQPVNNANLIYTIYEEKTQNVEKITIKIGDIIVNKK